MKIYIAGPMSGRENWNYAEFFRVEEELIALGHEVINPARANGDTLEEAILDVGTEENPTHPWEYYIRKDIKHVTDVDALCLLDGWQKSRGASLEVHLAKTLSMPLYILRNGELQPRIEIIGVSGYARSGKDTIAEKLKEIGYVRGSFADALREALYRLNPVISETGKPLADMVDELGWDDTKAYPEVRGQLQRIGTEVGRDMFGENFWVDYLIDNMPDGSKVVIPDVRFPNEADAILKMGGQLWRVERNGVGAINSHVSDSALDDYPFDTVIFNNDTIEHLYSQVDDLMAQNGA